MILFVTLIILLGIFLITRKSIISKVIGIIIVVFFVGILLLCYILAKSGMP